MDVSVIISATLELHFFKNFTNGMNMEVSKAKLLLELMFNFAFNCTTATTMSSMVSPLSCLQKLI
jgi:hypothetical protein